MKRRQILIAAGVGTLLALGGCGDRASFGRAIAYPPHVANPVPVTLPANAPSIEQEFYRFTADGQSGHLGIDIAGPKGTPVYAAAAGTVYLAYSDTMYGNRIIVDHGRRPDGRRYFTVYKHLDSRAVTPGTPVRQGQQIGTLGDTGVLASYPHLHFEVLRETAPGARTASGRNWWQGMQAEDPNLYWADGPGRPACAGTARGDHGPLPLIYPAACGT